MGRPMSRSLTAYFDAFFYLLYFETFSFVLRLFSYDVCCKDKPFRAGGDAVAGLEWTGAVRLTDCTSTYKETT